MADNQDLDPRKLTFSQAQRYEDVPGPLKLGELSADARREISDLFFDSVPIRYSYSVIGKTGYMDNPWASIFRKVDRDFFKEPADKFNPSESMLELYRDLIVNTLEFNRVFDLLQMIMRHPDCPSSFTTGVVELFERCRLAYVIDTNDPPTIFPATTREEGAAIGEAIRDLQAAGLHGAEAQLRKAAELINQGDWGGSVRESIHAVESVARQLDPKASKTLGPALTSLEKSGRLHPALKEAFSKLYGYTSNEEGIRHSLINAAASPAGRDEAVFMLGACASFASYLWRKHRGGS